MTKFLRHLILALSSLAASFCANATLIEKSNFVTDTTSGLDWLDFSETNGRSVSFVESQLGYGGLYGGWRFATMDDVKGLFNSAGGDGIYDRPKTSGLNIEVAPKVLDLLGSTRAADGFSRSASVHFKGNIVPELAGFHIREWLSDSYYNSVYMGEVIFATGGDEAGKAHALVRASAAEVPESSSIGLFVVGMAALGAFLRKRRG